MKTMVWLIILIMVSAMGGCVEKQGLVRVEKIVDRVLGGNDRDTRVIETKDPDFSASVAQEIDAINDFLATVKKSLQTGASRLTQQERATLKSAQKTVANSKKLLRNGQSYHALQKIQTVRSMMTPTITKSETLGIKGAVRTLVDRQMAVAKQRGRELAKAQQSNGKNRKMAAKKHPESNALLKTAKQLLSSGKHRRAYAQSEKALETLDQAIARVMLHKG